MPSPEDKLTLRQIAEATGLSLKVISSWRDFGYMKAVGKGKVNATGPFAHLFLWSDAAAIAAKYRPGRQDFRMQEALRPEGYMSLSDAAFYLTCSQATLRRGIANKQIPSVKTMMNEFCKKYFTYVERAAIERMKIARETKTDGMRMMPPAPAANPLLDADDDVCLKARRELWVSRGRVFPEKCRNCVDGKKRAG